MSDNSRPDKDALKKTWSAAKQLLCQFHVLQADWHWLTAAGNKDPKEDQRQLMDAFQKSWVQPSPTCPICRKPVDLNAVIKLHGATSCQAGPLCGSQLKIENASLKRQLCMAEHRATKNARVAFEKTEQVLDTMAKLADTQAQLAYWSTTARLSINLRREALATVRRITSTSATTTDADVDTYEADAPPGVASPSAPAAAPPGVATPSAPADAPPGIATSSAPAAAPPGTRGPRP
ncbi:uncharacterized protein LOC142588036 [Dermacentor variabilis]|uniref:uncharacterized protein LOC142588036 n=1 Tax=Dermacentor variabilis TaxID=34621 RepID=UPI003F5BFF80